MMGRKLQEPPGTRDWIALTIHCTIVVAAALIATFFFWNQFDSPALGIIFGALIGIAVFVIDMFLSRGDTKKIMDKLDTMDKKLDKLDTMDKKLDKLDDISETLKEMRDTLREMNGKLDEISGKLK